MIALADLSVHVDVLIDDALLSGAVRVPTRPGPIPAYSDAEVLSIAVVRHPLGRPSARFPGGGPRGLVPLLPPSAPAERVQSQSDSRRCRN
jgi:hypothetical protein